MSLKKMTNTNLIMKMSDKFKWSIGLCVTMIVAGLVGYFTPYPASNFGVLFVVGFFAAVAMEKWSKSKS
jgi:cobalamin synthase